MKHYQVGIYQQVKHNRPPSLSLAGNLADQIASKAGFSLFSEKIYTALEKFSPAHKRSVYVVFSTYGWDVIHELAMMKCREDRRNASKTRFYAIAGAELVSDIDIEQLAKKHIRKFGGRIKILERLGPVIEYLHCPTSEQIQDILHYYRIHSRKED